MAVMARRTQRSTRRGRISSGTVVVLCMFLGGIVLGLVALKFRRFEPLPGPMTTQPTSQPVQTQRDSMPATDRAADLAEQR